MAAPGAMKAIFSKNKEEHPEPLKAEVQGEVPSWMEGILIRNGPGMHTIGESKYNHWFDGMALLHSFTIKNGEVFYRSKYLRSNTYNYNIEANRIVVSEFGTMAYPDPSKNVFAKAFCYLSHMIPEFTDNCLISIVKIGEDYYAASEVNFITKINPQTLETLEKVDYRKYITINLVTAHPHYDSAGNIFNIGTSIVDKGKTKYVIFKIPPSAPENYIIFIEQPFKLDILKMATAYIRGVTWASCIVFDKDDKTWFHLIDKRTKQDVSAKFYTDAMVVLHHVNAYEEDDHMVFDVIAYPDGSLYQMFYLKNLNSDCDNNVKLSSIPTCKRFVVPLQYDKDAEIGTNLVRLPSTTATAVKEKDGNIYCRPEILCEGIEFPRINYDYNGKKYRYIFATDVKEGLVSTQVVKFDVLTKKSLYWEEKHCWTSEPIFVPSPNAKEEDDGIIMSTIVTIQPQKLPFLLILDAKTFKELARAMINVELHLDLHGIFIPKEDLKMEHETDLHKQHE